MRYAVINDICRKANNRMKNLHRLVLSAFILFGACSPAHSEDCYSLLDEKGKYLGSKEESFLSFNGGAPQRCEGAGGPDTSNCGGRKISCVVSQCYLSDNSGNEFKIKINNIIKTTTTCSPKSSMGPNIFEEKSTSGWYGVVEGIPVVSSSASYRYYQKLVPNFRL